MKLSFHFTIRGFWIKNVCCLLIALTLCSCSSTMVRVDALKPGGTYVRKLSYHRTPDAKELAERTRSIADEYYPKVCDVLWDATNTVRNNFNITFKNKVRLFGKKETGVAFMNQIMFNKSSLVEHRADLDFIVIHEVAHVAQNYWRFPFHWFIPDNYVCWVEGLADYVDYKLGLGDGPFCAECAASYPHYKQGYNCAGAFLLFLDETYGSQIVKQLNLELWQRSFSPDFFFRYTGKTLNHLWADFKKTEHYTPMAESFNQVRSELGYEGENNPPHLEKRFDAYLNKKFDAEHIQSIHEELKHLKLTNPDKKNSADLYAWNLYEKSPSGRMSVEALAMIKSLNKQERLPKFGDVPHDKKHPLMATVYLEKGYADTFPAARTFAFDFSGHPFRMHITLTKETPSSQWVLKRFWKSGSDGKLLKDYPIP